MARLLGSSRAGRQISALRSPAPTCLAPQPLRIPQSWEGPAAASTPLWLAFAPLGNEREASVLLLHCWLVARARSPIRRPKGPSL